MNRAQRRAGQRDGTVCEHGHPKKTDGNGDPVCPHRCGFRPGDHGPEHHRYCTRCDGPGPRPTGDHCPECGCPAPRPGDPTQLGIRRIDALRK